MGYAGVVGDQRVTGNRKGCPYGLEGSEGLGWVR